MEKQLLKLKEKYRTWQGVADKLQITYRHLCYIRAGKIRPRKPLETLIGIYANEASGRQSDSPPPHHAGE